MLQHADIRTFIQHYEVDVDVDVQGIVRKTGSRSRLVRFACSLSASIDPDRPYRLSAKESKSLNDLPEVRVRRDTIDEGGRIEKPSWNAPIWLIKSSFGHDEGALSENHRQLREKLELFQDRTVEAKTRYNKAVRELHNEKQRQQT